MNNITVATAQAAIAIVFAPLLTGVIKRIKCRYQCRRGPGLFQAYLDLWKLFRKHPTISNMASWIYMGTPYVVFGAVVSAAAMVPTLGANVLGLSELGLDAVVFTYFLAMARFSAALAAVDTAGSFGGMGASREMFISSMVEPGLLGVLFVIGLGSNMSFPDSTGGALSLMLATAALAILVVAETGRIPIDNPDTHLELTMVHEGMLLEYSGAHLAWLSTAAQVKQFVVCSLLASVIIPPNLWPFRLAAVFLIGAGLALVECMYAKMRLFKVPSLLFVAWALAGASAVASICL